ncbi:MAG: glycosyltransferase family 9 protein [Bacteroidetes bacterium]|nr:glycosyltransferase family 9 protein [Bacteroidota bacterium]
MEIKKVLIIQTASIGDVILATPLIEKLNISYPDAQIDFMLKKGNEALFNDHPIISNLIIWNKFENKYRNLIDIINHNRDEKYDLIVNLQRFLLTGLATVLSRARKTIGFNKNPLSLFFSNSVKHRIAKNGNIIHEIDRNLALVKRWTNNKSTTVKLYPSKADYAKTSQYKTHQYICVAPKSLWFTKEFPFDKWVEFIKEIDPSYYIYFIGSSVDRGHCQQIIDRSGNKNTLNLAGKLTLLESAALMKEASMNYVNDSAPLHLASSVNAPITAIFCSTVEAFGFGPLSGDSVIIETNEELKCRPCGLHGLKACPETHFKCAYTINKNQLLKRIN